MIPMTLSDVARAVGGHVEGDGAARVTSVSIDTRRLRPGALFVALRGARDGHDFVAAAFAAGAAGALVGDGRDVPRAALVRAGDPLAALHALARAVRARLAARVVAITGSSGKTLTKELTAAALSRRFRTAASEASFNNEIGVPLTVLAVGEGTEVVVCEIGSRGRGHISHLLPVARPDVGVVTNVGVAHIGRFGSADAIADAKAELVEGLRPDGVAVLNADDDRVAKMASRTPARVVTFGLGPSADVRAARIALDDEARARFTALAGGEEAEVALGIPGEHMVPNALAAIAAARALGVPLADAARGCAAARPLFGRMEVMDAPGGWRVINDAYNANPASTAAALRTLVQLGRGRRTWAVLGEMAELGGAAAAEHDRIGRLAVRLGVGRLITVGSAARMLHDAARAEGMAREEAQLVPDAAAAAARVLTEIAPGDVVLVKASRAGGLEEVVERLVSGE